MHQKFKEIPESNDLSVLDEFSSKYGIITEESARMAAEKSPMLLARLIRSIKDEETRAILLEALSFSEDESLCDMLILYLDSGSERVRLAVVTALHSYAEDSESLADRVIFPALRELLQREESVEIKIAISSALECNTFYFDPPLS